MDEKDVGQVVEGQGAGQGEVDNSKRNIMAALMGSLGVAALAGCTTRTGEAEREQEAIGQAADAIQHNSGQTPVRWCQTMAELRSAWSPPDWPQPQTGDVCVLEGYRSSGDGGGGLFYWDAASNFGDDGGTVVRPQILSELGRWKRIYSGPLNVKWFGAMGDGVEEDTVTLQRAVDAAGPAGTVYIPRTSAGYLLKDCINVPWEGLTIRSDGARLVQTGDYKRGLYVTGARVRVDGVWLFNDLGWHNWNSGYNTEARGVYIEAPDVAITHCRIENWGCAGVWIQSGAGCLISNNEIIGIGPEHLRREDNWNSGIYSHNTGGTGTLAGLRIENNRIRDCGHGICAGNNQANITIANNEIINIIAQHGLYIDCTENLSIVGNTIRNTGLSGIKLAFDAQTSQMDGRNVSVVGNTVDTTGQCGIIVGDNMVGVTHRQKGVSVVGNTVLNAASEGICLDGCDSFVVGNNVVVGAGDIGIFVRDRARNGIIADNYVEASGSSGMTLAPEGAQYHILVSGNYLHNCVTNPAVNWGYYRSGIYATRGSFTIRDNRVDYTGSVPGSYLYSLCINAESESPPTVVSEYNNILSVSGSSVYVSGGAVVNATGPKSYHSRNDQGTFTLDPRTDAITQEWTNVPGNTIVQFNSNALRGDRFRITKTGSLGPGSITILLSAGNKTMLPGACNFADVEYDGVRWVLTAYGGL